jgi:hypothetical protein
MNRKRTATTLALLALLTTGVVGGISTLAHSEEINGEFTAVETPAGKHILAVYDGVQTSNPVFETTNARIECENAKFNANTATGTDPKLTFSASYSECDLVFPVKLPATVFMNECDFDFEQPIEQKKDEYSGPISINCPAGKRIEIKIYAVGTTKQHSGLLCTATIYPAQHLTKTTYEDQTKAVPTDFTLNAEIKQVPYEEDGDCPDETGKVFIDGELHGRSTITGTTAAGKATDVSID